MLIDKESNKNLYFHRGGEDKKSYYFKRKDGKELYKIQSEAIEETLYIDALELIQKCSQDKDKLYSFYKKIIFNNAEFNEDKLKQQIKELNRDYERVLEDYFAGKISESIFETEAKKYSSKIKKVEQLLENTDEQIAKIDVFNLKFKKFIGKLKDVPMDTYKLIQMVISKVYISPLESENEFDIAIVYKIEQL
jgi:hypothetical protein